MITDTLLLKRYIHPLEKLSMVTTSRYPTIKYAGVRTGREHIGSGKLNFRLRYTF
jgi:hypothetical protein